MWLSLVERCVRDAEAAGSSPVISTKNERPSKTVFYFFVKYKQDLNLLCPCFAKQNGHKIVATRQGFLVGSCHLDLVGASYVSLAPIFYEKNQSALTPLLLLFRQKPRSVRLLGCKRPPDGSQSLPPFCELH